MDVGSLGTEFSGIEVESEFSGRVFSILDGTAFLALADGARATGPWGGVGCDLTPTGSERAATDEERIRQYLRGVDRPWGADGGGTTLSFSDFAPSARTASVADGYVTVHGALSGDPYRLPIGMITLSRRRVVTAEPPLLGTGRAHDEHSVARATADIVACDVVRRWWQRPNPHVPAKIGMADTVLPEPVRAALSARDLEVLGYAWAAEGTWVTVVALAGDGRRSVSCGIAVGPRTTAVRTAFCRALHMRVALGWPEYRRSLGAPEIARLVSVWHQGPEHIAYLEENATGSDHAPSGDDEREVDVWLDRATRRFGHEPVVLRSPDPDDPAVVNVFCPGAAIYRRSSVPLPCPV